jgi:hypothetical protein
METVEPYLMFILFWITFSMHWKKDRKDFFLNFWDNGFKVEQTKMCFFVNKKEKNSYFFFAHTKPAQKSLYCKNMKNGTKANFEARKNNVYIFSIDTVWTFCKQVKSLYMYFQLWRRPYGIPRLAVPDCWLHWDLLCISCRVQNIFWTL